MGAVRTGGRRCGPGAPDRGRRAERDREVATRTRPITGLSEFPNLSETRPDREGAGDGVRRYGAAFEALRADRPSAHVFLATLGSVAAHTARAGFATNLLAAGGVDVDTAGATAGVDDLVAAYLAAEPVVCLAGTDAAYAEWGKAAAAALRHAGARRVVVAGVSTRSTAELFAEADDSCALGVDAIEFLDADQGGAPMSIPTSFAGLSLNGGAVVSTSSTDGPSWHSPEGIEIKPRYDAANLEGLDSDFHEHAMP